MLLKIFHKDKHYSEYINIFWLEFWMFNFRWFIENKEWFIYIEFKKNKKHWIGYRFSSAGNMKINHKEEERKFT
jgi:hypothetical protein